MNMKRDLKKIGKSAYACIKEMVDRLEEDDQNEEARETILEDPLSIEVRSDWHAIGESDSDSHKDGEYRILLATGGPAVRMVGELTDGQPTSASLEVQDWGTPWTEYIGTPGPSGQVLLAYASVFTGENDRGQSMPHVR
jgi:hypothetical protein